MSFNRSVIGFFVGWWLVQPSFAVDFRVDGMCQPVLDFHLRQRRGLDSVDLSHSRDEDPTDEVISEDPTDEHVISEDPKPVVSRNSLLELSRPDFLESLADLSRQPERTWVPVRRFHSYFMSIIRCEYVGHEVWMGYESYAGELVDTYVIDHQGRLLTGSSSDIFLDSLA